jgi:uncharacterized cupin superfamily protein
MKNPETTLIRAGAQGQEFEIRHPLNANSQLWLRPLGRLTGLQRVGITLARLPPGKESFIYHSHQHEEEFVYILAGRGIAEIDDTEFEVGPGDFMGFPTPSVAHHLRNPFDTDLVYLMGGEHREVEIADFPRLNKRLIRDGTDVSIVDCAAIEPLFR